MQPYTHNSAVAKAVTLRESGRLAASLSLLHVACDETPDDAEAWHQLGLGYARAGKLDYARDCLSRAAALTPDRMDVLAHLANVFVLRKEFDAAITLGRRLVASNPRSVEYQLFLGNLYASCGKLDEALPFVQAAASMAPATSTPYLLLARILLSRRQFAGARAAAEKVLELEPDNAMARQISLQLTAAPG